MDDGSEYPLVLPDDDGIRPAGKPDECFYCRQKVGQPHGRTCVAVSKKVKVSFTTEILVDVPYHWDEDSIDYQFNDGTWCADNLRSLIDQHLRFMELARRAHKPHQHCMCSTTTAKYISTVPDSGPVGQSKTEAKAAAAKPRSGI